MNSKSYKPFSSLTRRSFLSCVAAAGCAMALPRPLFSAANKEAAYPAEYIEKLPDGRLRCVLCPNSCMPNEGENGRCHARGVRDGKYVSLVHGLPCVIAVDPVEKMPLFHYHVRSPALSIATAGCNLACQYCQNWQFSQHSPAEIKSFAMTPSDVVMRALDMRLRTIGFFYTEPVIYIEFMKQVAAEAKKKNIRTIMVTAGYINPEPLSDLMDLIDVFVVGFKGFTQEFYDDVIEGEMQAVKDCLLSLKKADKYFEVVSLLIPGKNDSLAHVQKGVDWFINNLGPQVPWHFSRFVPEFKLKNLPPTPNSVLERARTAAINAGIKHVYTGNNPGQEGNHTYCPSCGKRVVDRVGFQILQSLLKQGKCPDCGFKLPGIWLDDLPTGNIGL